MSVELLLPGTGHPLLSRHRRLPKDSGWRKEIVLEERRLDARHAERHRLDGVVQDAEGARELDGANVANVLGKERKTLVEAWRAIG